MTQLLNEIQWGEPLLPRVSDPAWEADARRRGGHIGEMVWRTAPSPWLREACVEVQAYRPVQIPPRLADIGNLVTAQENSCRYCYGSTRAFMKVMGYPESFINGIERDAQEAELDEKERQFIAFCRNLARSRPRPAAADREMLLRSGFSPLAVAETAFYVAASCFYHRVATFLACPPELRIERFANSPMGRLIGLAAPLVRKLAAGRQRPQAVAESGGNAVAAGPFGAIIATLAGLPAAALMRQALEGAFASTVLPARAKTFMFAVVARSLECRFCSAEARGMLEGDGFTPGEIESTLAALASPRLDPLETRLLHWVRSTVHYEPAQIQDETRALAAEIGEARVLEAIGVAALANATVRLAMLRE